MVVTTESPEIARPARPPSNSCSAIIPSTALSATPVASANCRT
jgi:hypothetical protein